ncbi:GDSL-type esterase/lipase family protein [Streptomyces sp. MAR25Y5]|uniref:GDSL-type esterase/lipase family protein n=1 Tax=Streptomyces sp. MAR25Y5 TaxID=2962028 RepID=UPI0035A877FC
MRVVIVTESLPPEVNGVAHCALQTARHLADRGHLPVVVAPATAGDEADDRAPCPVVRIPSLPLPGYPQVRVALPGRRLTAAIAGHRADLVHLPAGTAAARHRRLPRPRRQAAADRAARGVGDRTDGGGRGWAALLADSLGERPARFTDLARSGARTHDVLEAQLPAAPGLRPDLVSVVVGVNDTLRRSFDIHAVAGRPARTAQGAVLLAACLPDPGGVTGLPGAPVGPPARLQHAVDTVVHALSHRYGAVHLHAGEGDWVTDRAMWGVDRMRPGERGTANRL